MLRVESLTCGYGDITAVADVTFAVKAGEVFGLIGSNGAGKTTTLLAIAGLINARSGQILVNDKQINFIATHLRIDHGIALVPEGRRLFADLSVDENLTVGGTRLTTSRLETNRQRVFDIFPRLAERRRQQAGSLSGGEQQMLAIGRAVMSEPKMMLIDELSLGLMPKAIDECYETLRSLQRDGLAILLVEQSTERVLHFASQIGVLESGRLVWSGTGEQALDNTNIVSAYLGTAD